MKAFPRITHDPQIMGGKACLRDTRVTVGVVVGHLAGGYTPEQLLHDYPYLQADDINEALAYAAYRMEEQEFDLKQHETAHRYESLPSVDGISK